MNYVNGCCITKEMVLDHAKMHDECFMGTIVLEAIGINGACTGFCICKADCFNDGNHINVFWTLDGYDGHMETFHIDEIMLKLDRIKVVIERK